MTGSTTVQAFVAWAAAALLGVAPLDTAYINGSTDGHAWEIAVRSDGAATIYSAYGTRSFNIQGSLVTRFFVAVKGVHDDDWPSFICPTPPPFMGSPIRVTWHGWASPNIICSPKWTSPNDDMSGMILWHSVQLNNTVAAIIVLAGRPAAIPCTELPREDQPPGCGR
ncbi:MAG: hypothetical protein ABSF08_00155 [Candidatus Cybelea sp.]